MNDVEKKYDIETPVPEKLINVELRLLCSNKKLLSDLSNRYYNYLFQNSPTAKKPRVLQPFICDVTTRKSPCGQGTATWSKYKMIIHGRMFALQMTHQMLKDSAAFLQNTDVEVRLTLKG
ncbi:40S ribosomal protein S20 [Spraguea lophii 42_110]|uniref:40S ribosomal protein S20 n=1 Tax=Spraguea lophii (strain 42_110) TaxID=1358809 RepID=S7W986_SPRLO|nr:Chain SU0, 40S ribosomal protein S20 [Spraguea lophii 42_110]7QJH_RU0 Chain RU0, 40S ribosomal protein S20 [Spraguea lophii 42_110]7QJH_SU0 Chain SU0, 40S ribosomal protein S20 [Spraguea lophii 42_110]8BR3_SU0 Chain SU0, 40S ribosomal protein S20 [Spraguea lophii 42_110]8P5D_SU0 Chain SU0, 40S ribosomal protein S20 [Spraguea lophii 42_110]8P60_RU0 Chain RU0, 40S ribosomal protein S20 [Spraguea lophii 42_110]8P60_SU0 Chain SU0, 40S ribosomal protein S20 [Spraguea lophii 42_110]EPR79495.1 4